MTRRPLLAGSYGPERVPPRPDPEQADWFLPLHVRDAAAARARIGAQVAAGADIVVAPSWLTHRRALLPVAETRRVAAWTAAAVEVAREGVELGLERREEQLAEAPEHDARRDRPPPLVAATLPALGQPGERERGRLLPREAATERDYRDQAGALADAEPDLLLVEGQPSATEARIAMREAIDTGLPVWAALDGSIVAAEGPERWLDPAGHIRLDRLLLPSAADPSRVAATRTPWGVVTTGTPAGLGAWLAAGAGAVAVLDGARPATLEPIRRAIDEREQDELEAARSTRRRWEALVQRAAAIAPGGAAVWLGDQPAASLPEGFDWLVVPATEARHLPTAHYRLVVLAEGATGDMDPGRWLEPGGILAGREVPALADAAGLRVIARDPSGAPALAVYRREG